MANGELCGRHCKSTGKPCRRLQMANGACYVHGGNTPKGLEHPLTKTGRYSKHLPTQYAGRAKELIASKDLLDLRENVVLLDLRIQELIKQVESDSDNPVWKQIASLGDDRRRMVESISKVELQSQQVVTLDVLLMLMGKLAEHFNRVNLIDDADERRQAFRDGQDSLLRLVE